MKNPAQGWNWTPKPSEVPLLAQVVVGGAPRPVTWTFREATPAADTNGTTLTLRFTSAEPALELKSVWRARPGVGPVEHQISVVNNTAGPIVFQGDNVEAANLNLVADKPVQFFPLDQAIVGPGEGTPLPYQIVKVGSVHGIYFAYDYGCGQYKATRDLQDPLRVNCRFWVGNKVSTTIAAGEPYHLPGIMIQTYQGDSTLSVFVNDVQWRETDSLAGAAATDRSFITSTDDEDKTSVSFGNGRQGARLPTGVGNVRAEYRSGIGKPGNVKAGQVSLLTTRPLGVKEVVNPLRASGGADRETRHQARKNAPLAVKALDRLVSVRDYGDFARTYAGIGKAVARELPDGRRQLVHVTIAGADDIPIDETSDLYRNLRQALLEYGDPYQQVQLAVRELLFIVISARLQDPNE